MSQQIKKRERDTFSLKIDNNTLVHSMKRVVDNLGTDALFFFFFLFVTAPHTWDEKALDYPEDGKYVV